MIFTETKLSGAWLIDLDPHTDERGFFARSFCRREFRGRGLNPDVQQCNVSFNHRRGTLRGLHLQRPPREEVKLVRCVAGAAWDVMLDLRPDSPTLGRWRGTELTAENRRSVYVPAGFAHGFLTLRDDTELLYQMSQAFDVTSMTGVRYDDPQFAIEWPFEPTVISDRDRQFADFDPAIMRPSAAFIP